MISDRDFINRAPLSWHIKGVLPQAELAVVYGPSGSGKSFFVFDMVSAIATGTKWHGRIATRGRVVFVLAEGATGFRNRLKAYAMGHAGALPEVAIIIDAPDLLHDRDHPQLAQEIERSGGTDLIVIDTLAASCPGADENAAKDMGRVVEHCKQLHKLTGATVLLIHHSGKDESRGARGWSGLRAAVDAEIEISRSGDYREAEVTKLKDGEDGARFGFKLIPVEVDTDADGDAITSCVVEPVTAVTIGEKPKSPKSGTVERALLDALRDNPSTDGRGHIEPVIDSIVGQLPEPDGRDTRKQHLMRALRSLASKGYIAIEGEQCRLL